MRLEGVRFTSARHTDTRNPRAPRSSGEIEIAPGTPATPDPSPATRSSSCSRVKRRSNRRHAGDAQAGVAIVVPPEVEFGLTTGGEVPLHLLGCRPLGGHARTAVGLTFTPACARDERGPEPAGSALRDGYRDLIESLHGRLRERSRSTSARLFGFALLAARDRETTVTEPATLIGRTKQAGGWRGGGVVGVGASRLAAATGDDGYLLQGVGAADGWCCRRVPAPDCERPEPRRPARQSCGAVEPERSPAIASSERTAPPSVVALSPAQCRLSSLRASAEPYRSGAE